MIFRFDFCIQDFHVEDLSISDVIFYAMPVCFVDSKIGICVFKRLVIPYCNLNCIVVTSNYI